MFQSILDKKKLILDNYVPSTPVAFIYGKRALFLLTGDKWKNYLLEHEHCELHGV